MKPKVLINKSDAKRSQLALILNQLGEEFEFTVVTSDKDLIQQMSDRAKTIYRKGIPEPETFGDYFFFTLILPFIFLVHLFRLIRFRFVGYKTVLFTSLHNKIVVTPFARLLGFRVIWFENDYIPTDFRLNFYSLCYRLWHRLTTVVCTSQAVCDDLKNTYKLKEKNLRVINRGVDLAALKAQSDIYEDIASKEYQHHNEALFVIGYIGDLKIENGLEYLIKTIEYIRELIPDFQIIIVGDGPEKKNLIWLTKMLGVQQQVRFVGHQKNIQRWYGYFNILVAPRTVRTNFSNVVAEAMAAGVPVVSTQVPGIQEIVNQQGGILVEPKNTDRLSQAIFEMFNDKGMRAQFSMQAKARIEQYFSQDRMIQEYRKLFSTKER